MTSHLPMPSARTYTSALINASTDMETGTETVHSTSECMCNASQTMPMEELKSRMTKREDGRVSARRLSEPAELGNLVVTRLGDWARRADKALEVVTLASGVTKPLYRTWTSLPASLPAFLNYKQKDGQMVGSFAERLSISRTHGRNVLLLVVWLGFVEVAVIVAVV
ncbi:hypothetical protein B0T13DRAFT_450990 [Neurospora crassa]|nr:hypothetical protein B0T13DRAFT_450990 [Neurospora crassa]